MRIHKKAKNSSIVVKKKKENDSFSNPNSWLCLVNIILIDCSTKSRLDLYNF